MHCECSSAVWPEELLLRKNYHGWTRQSFGCSLDTSLDLAPGTPQVDWTESINAYLRKIPNNLTLPDFLEDNRALGMEIGSAHLTGLGDLWALQTVQRRLLSS
ncbi:hypothetical protein MTO96_011720 [Rhipicephalus appendiculatus]